jgi:CRP/FNR family transcriptional regulator, cyclic AMP receptor protein
MPARDAMSPSNRLWQALPEPLRVELEAIATPKHWSPGALLFQEGVEHEAIYLLLDGHVRLEMLARDRGRVPLMTVGAGDVVGWSPLFGGHPMTATATALEPTHAFAFDGKQLRDLCAANHELGYHVMRHIAMTLSERLLATRLQLLDLFREHEPRPSRAVDAEC